MRYFIGHEHIGARVGLNTLILAAIILRHVDAPLMILMRHSPLLRYAGIDSHERRRILFRFISR